MNFEESPELPEKDTTDKESSYKEYEDLIEYYENTNLEISLEAKVECGAYIKEFKEILSSLLEDKMLAILNTLETEEEALNSEERKSAKEVLIPLVEKMNFLKKKTDITEEEYANLYKKYKIFSRAVGIINNGVVDHDR